jgi:hypothetical protein
MGNQGKYFIIYLCVLGCLIGTLMQLAQAQELTAENPPASELMDQASLDQILAPIALYPDTLLSHILIAATYPLEVVQTDRWRQANLDLNEQQVLDAVADKDWDPSIQALAPFTALLQTLSQDLDWLQALGNGFLANEQQVLSSIQTLRQKAYAQGNLKNNEYLEVQQQQDQIVIQNVVKQRVYIPYYDTRLVYGNWWWNNHPPYHWHSPRHYVWNAGVYWSPHFSIRPSFYFGGVHWKSRHLVANYGLRGHNYRTWNNHRWHNSHSNKSNWHNPRHSLQRVKVAEYPRWKHNKQHRRGVQYQANNRRLVSNVEKSNGAARVLKKSISGSRQVAVKNRLKYNFANERKIPTNQQAKYQTNRQGMNATQKLGYKGKNQQRQNVQGKTKTTQANSAQVKNQNRQLRTARWPTQQPSSKSKVYQQAKQTQSKTRHSGTSANNKRVSTVRRTARVKHQQKR